MSAQIGGIIPPVITCFDKNGKIDENAQKELVRYLSKHVQGFYPCGTYGSGPLMTSEERKRVAEIVIKEKAMPCHHPCRGPFDGRSARSGKACRIGRG